MNKYFPYPLKEAYISFEIYPFDWKLIPRWSSCSRIYYFGWLFLGIEIAI